MTEQHSDVQLHEIAKQEGRGLLEKAQAQTALHDGLKNVLIPAVKPEDDTREKVGFFKATWQDDARFKDLNPEERLAIALAKDRVAGAVAAGEQEKNQTPDAHVNQQTLEYQYVDGGGNPRRGSLSPDDLITAYEEIGRNSSEDAKKQDAQKAADFLKIHTDIAFSGSSEYVPYVQFEKQVLEQAVSLCLGGQEEFNKLELNSGKRMALIAQAKKALAPNYQMVCAAETPTAAAAPGEKPETRAVGLVKTNEATLGEDQESFFTGCGIKPENRKAFDSLWQKFQAGKLSGSELVGGMKNLSESKMSLEEFNKKLEAARILYRKAFGKDAPVVISNNPDALIKVVVDTLAESLHDPTIKDKIINNLGGTFDTLRTAGTGQNILQLLMVLGSLMSSFASTAEEAAK